MRFFSPFAVLGLLHVARGGELDAFAADRARNIREGLAGRSVPVVDTSNASSTSPTSDLPNTFKREVERRELHERALKQLDTNKDDHIEHDEIVRSLAMHWKGDDNARRMMRAFGGGGLEDFMRRNSPDDDGRVPKEVFTEILAGRPLEKPEHCPAIRTKVESCPTHQVLKCGAYLNAAELFCNAGHKNLIEKCIMSESCANICDCINAVEDAAHGEAAIMDEGRLVQVHLNSLGLPESGLQTRQIELLLGLFIWALIEFIVGNTYHLTVVNIYESLTSANPWMDTLGTEKVQSRPAARTFTGVTVAPFSVEQLETVRMAVSGCLATRAKTTSDTEAKDVNPKGCPCSLFDWSEFDNQDMPGFDMDKGSFFTDKVSVCRNACAGNSTCQAFVITPFSGNENDKRPNCYLKTAQRQTMTVTGSTVFFKRSKNGNCGAPTMVSGVPFDDDWYSTSTGTDRRSISEKQHTELLPRAHKGEVPFPFDRSTAGYLTLAFLSLVYQRIASEFTWRRNLLMQRPIGATTASSHVGGGSTGRPSDAPYLAYLPLPQWRPTEIGYRVNGIFRQIINLAVTQNVDDPLIVNDLGSPVSRWLSQNAPAQGNAGQFARFPDSVRQLLTANSAVVHDLSRGNGDTWIGRSRSITGGETAPYAGVRAGYDQNMNFYQRGGMGPFSLEAAFIMATQLAGVNFRAVARSYQSNPAGWWMGVLTNGVTSNECLSEEDSEGTPVRTYGRFQSGSGGGTSQHDPRAGVYMAFDLDPDLSADDANHNVFVFVVHTLDANSVVATNEAQLRAVNVGTATNWYTPSNGGADALFWNRGRSSNTVTMPTSQSTTRLLAVFQSSHYYNVSCNICTAHAAIVRRSTFDAWLTGTQATFPSYTQVSYAHMYVLTEDWALTNQDNPEDWPRKQWFNNGAGGGSSS
ncbi:papain cysteine protease family protein [Ceratobasidium sp. AG-Ba]|nr:papain cysteine protease family protein [Ceratobasidium sp. AG-Ba]